MTIIPSSAPCGARAAVSPEIAASSVGDAGRLVLIVGPSGAGKDSLIDYCRERLAGSDRVVFPRRIITREDAGGTEDHVTVSEDDFHRMVSEMAVDAEIPEMLRQIAPEAVADFEDNTRRQREATAERAT